MKIAVTGANGFVGRHVVARLLPRRHEVRALVSERPGSEGELPGGGAGMEVRRADVRRPETLRGAFDGVDAIAQALVAALERGDISGVHELGGPEAVTYDEMLEETMRGTGIRRPRVHLPVLLVKPAAFAMTVMPDPPVTIDQLDLLAVDNTPKNNALEPVFGVRPRPFKGALDYLRRR